jgi:hypothetical protein
MYVAFDVNQTRDYQLKKHQGPKEPIFVLGVLDSSLAAHLADTGVTFSRPQKDEQEAEVKVHTNVKNREIVRFGLKSVRNMKDAAGNDVVLELQEFSTPIGMRRGLTDASLNLVKPDINELADVIDSDNTLTEDDAKN